MQSNVACVVLAFAVSVSGGDLPQAPPSEVIVYDLRYTTELNPVAAWEHQHFVTALGGIVNRNSSRLYAIIDDTAMLWYNYSRGPGRWMEWTVFKEIVDIVDLYTYFKADVRGAALWNPDVPATSNVASTAAGVMDLLPIMRGGELEVEFGAYDLSVLLDLTHLKSKNDAYRWAIAEFLTSGLCNPRKLAYYVDAWAVLSNATGSLATYMLTKVSNHDYFIANKAFFFDLSIWDDEVPVDDPTQALGTDYNTAITMLNETYRLLNGSEMVHVGGFTPWWFKYTKEGQGCPNCKHGGVETEDQTMFIFTAFNCFDDGDACCVGSMSNAALWQHFPLPHQMLQAPLPTTKDLEKQGLIVNESIVEQAYCAYYGGDYDGSSWVYGQLIHNWNDTNRGKTPIGWAIDSELSMRFPIIFPYLYETRTDNDFFIMGDSGAGYLNPTQLFPPRAVSNITQSGAPVWTAWNEKYYTQFNISLTGFIINANAGPIMNQSYDMFQKFSPQGVVAGREQGRDWEALGDAWLHNGMPVFQHTDDLPDDAADAVAMVTSVAQKGPKLAFYVHRTILKTASYMHEVATNTSSSCKWVDPYTLSLLAQLTEHGEPPVSLFK